MTASDSRPSGGPPSATSGTGFIISRAGHVMTNYHVVNSCKRVSAVYRGVDSELTPIAEDQANDLAVLKLNAKEIENVARFRSGRRLRRGDDVVAVGFPLMGLLSSETISTFGNINSLSGPGDDSRLVQISAEVQPGNSGGPVLDSNGNVAAIIVAKLDALVIAKMTGDIPQNVNFAINAVVARAFLDAHGIEYEIGVEASEPPKTAIAELAAKFTVPVLCH